MSVANKISSKPEQNLTKSTEIYRARFSLGHPNEARLQTKSFIGTPNIFSAALIALNLGHTATLPEHVQIKIFQTKLARKSRIRFQN